MPIWHFPLLLFWCQYDIFPFYYFNANMTFSPFTILMPIWHFPLLLFWCQYDIFPCFYFNASMTFSPVVILMPVWHFPLLLFWCRNEFSPIVILCWLLTFSVPLSTPAIPAIFYTLPPHSSHIMVTPSFNSSVLFEKKNQITSYLKVHSDTKNLGPPFP